MDAPAELPPDTYSEIVEMARQGDAFMQGGKPEAAALKYRQALKRLPPPITDWEAATWLFAAIGDAYWFAGDHRRAYLAFQRAFGSPEGPGNPFIHLRLGQLAYERGDHQRARDQLLRAYMAAGIRIFEREDRKYCEAIADLLDPSSFTDRA